MYELKIDIPAYINEIITQLQDAGFEAYIVGGCVRDALLEKTPNDWDICTSARPEAVKDVLRGFKVFDTGIAHGTVTAVKNENACEITTFRSDGKYTDHRHPESVSFTSDLKSDLSRRDFTVNAMAYSQNTGFIDVFGGQEDLNSGILRCVGDPETRFTEDALRIIRALRFSSCLGFKIEEKTKAAIYSCCELTNCIAIERIYGEFKRLICGDYASEIICEFSPVFERVLDFENIQKNAHLLKKAPKNIPLRIAVLFLEKEPSAAYEMLKNLKSDNNTIKSVTFLLKNIKQDLKLDRLKMRKLLSDFGRDQLLLLTEFVSVIKGYSKLKKDTLLELINTAPLITLSNLAINGSDIIELGIAPGRQIKSLLNAALDAVVCEKCENEKTKLISFILNIKS